MRIVEFLTSTQKVSLPSHWRIEIERKARRKRLSITIRPSGHIVIFCQKGTRPTVIHQFLLDHRKWVEQQLKRSQKIRLNYPAITFIDGELVMFKGKVYSLKCQLADKVRFEITSGQIRVSWPRGISRLPAEKRFYYRKRAFQIYYKKQAKRLMDERVGYWSEKMQLRPRKVSYRGQKTLWGSCSSDGKLSFNWKLMVFPLEVIDYVVIHELAHLVYRDHSSRFWHLVSQYCENWREQRKFLNNHQYEADFLSSRSELYPELSLV